MTLLFAGLALAACGSGSSGGDGLDQGRAVYGSVCSTCHGADGVGGDLAPSLAEVTATFPDCTEHIRWITLGTDGWKTEVGPTYGADAREVTRVMPGFGGSLSPEEIAQVAAFERVRYGGDEPEVALAECT